MHLLTFYLSSFAVFIGQIRVSYHATLPHLGNELHSVADNPNGSGAPQCLTMPTDWGSATGRIGRWMHRLGSYHFSGKGKNISW